MSSLTTLLLLGAQASAGAGIAAADPIPALTADAALANEQAMIVAAPAHCGTAPEGEIIVCARRAPGPSPRLPFPDQRAEEGEIVRYAGEPDATAAFDSHSCARPGSCEPPRLMETIAKTVGAIVHAVRGEEAPVPPYP